MPMLSLHNNLFRFKENGFYQRLDGSVFKGQIKDVTEIGKLIVQTELGEEEFAFKEVKYIL